MHVIDLARRLALAAALTATLSCAYGTDTTRTVRDTPTLSVSGAPEGATLVVDGIDFGPAADFAADSPVEVLPGVHVVEIRQGSEVVHREEVYVGTGSTTAIAVPNGR